MVSRFAQKYDHSDLITELQVLQQVLRDRSPEGEWKHHHLLLRYRINHYGLRLKEAKQLRDFLRTEVGKLR